MRAYNGDNYMILTKSRNEPNPLPSASADNARLKEIIKMVKPLSKKGLASMTAWEEAALYDVLSLAPRQLRKRILKKAGLKMVRPEQ